MKLFGRPNFKVQRPLYHIYIRRAPIQLTRTNVVFGVAPLLHSKLACILVTIASFNLSIVRKDIYIHLWDKFA